MRIGHTWEFAAKHIDEVYNTYVDWEERFFICPECDEPIYEDDYPTITFDIDDEVLICPVCEEELDY